MKIFEINVIEEIGIPYYVIGENFADALKRLEEAHLTGILAEVNLEMDGICPAGKEFYIRTLGQDEWGVYDVDDSEIERLEALGLSENEEWTK